MLMLQDQKCMGGHTLAYICYATIQSLSTCKFNFCKAAYFPSTRLDVLRATWTCSQCVTCNLNRIRHDNQASANVTSLNHTCDWPDQNQDWTTELPRFAPLQQQIDTHVPLVLRSDWQSGAGVAPCLRMAYTPLLLWPLDSAKETLAVI